MASLETLPIAVIGAGPVGLSGRSGSWSAASSLDGTAAARPFGTAAPGSLDTGTRWSPNPAANSIIGLADLAKSTVDTVIIWATRSDNLTRVFGGGDGDGLPARGKLGAELRALTENGSLSLVQNFRIEGLREVAANLDEAGLALLEEELRSLVLDTAPTGHTLLLLDAAESYHREVLRTSGHAPEEVRRLLPRLRDPNFTKNEARFHREVHDLATRVAVVPWLRTEGTRLHLFAPQRAENGAALCDT